MELTRRQKRTLEKFSKNKSIEELANITKLPKETIESYLKKNNETKSRLDIDLKKFSLRIWIKQNYLFLIFFTVLVIIAYTNSLGNQFLSDDIGIIRDNNIIGTLKYTFADPLVCLRVVFYTVILKLFGRNPVFFRLMNIFFHLGSIYLFFFIISCTFSKKIAIFATSIFAVHPILIENVTWISGGFYPQYGFFLLLSLYFYILSQKFDRRYFWSIFFFFIALLSAERSIFYPAVLILWELCFGNLRQNWKRICPFFIVGFFWGIVYVSSRVKFRAYELTANFYQKRSFANPLVQLPVAISSYFELIFWPKNLTLYHSELNFSKINFAIRFLTTLSFLCIVIYSFFKNKPIFFWLAFFIITLSPALTPLNISWVFAERYVYLGSIGIFVTIAYLIEKGKKYYKEEKFYYVILVLLLIPLITRTIVRNIDWTDQDHLWLAAAKTSPSSHQNHNNLGDYWARHGDFQKAVEEFQRAIELLPNYADAYHNMGTSYHQLGKDDLALASYERAIYFNPNLWQSYQNIGAILFGRGDIENAEKFYQKAAEINLNSSVLHTALGIINLKKGDMQKAHNEFGIAVELDPANQEAKAGFLQTQPKN